MRDSKEQQLFFMQKAIQVAEKGRYTAPPNPWVGCLIVKEGRIVGEGYHEAAGKKHAEIVALEQAASLARGSTAYVSLEPCAHHGRTPPCTQALIRAGVRKVVTPLLDPDPQVAGTGIKILKEAGIEVEVGVGEELAKAALEPYLFQRTHRRPFCLLKTALSLDGRVAARDGSSQWITGEEARADVHLLRAASQAIIVGARTALLDSPRLTVRAPLAVQLRPLRVLIDAKGRVPPQGPLADTSLAPTLVVTSSSIHKEGWEQKGAEVMVREHLDLKELMEQLAKRGVIQALLEGGSHLHASFLKAHLVDRLVVYLGACLLGDQGMPFIPNLPISSIKEAPRLQLLAVQRFQNDLRLDYNLKCDTS